MFIITATTTSITIYLYYSVVESNLENVFSIFCYVRLRLNSNHNSEKTILTATVTTFRIKISHKTYDEPMYLYRLSYIFGL